MFKKKDNKALRSNSGGTCTWQQKTENKPRAKVFRDSIMTTKEKRGGENCYEAVLMPEVEDDDLDSNADSTDILFHQHILENEWVAENLVDFFHELNMLSQVLVYNNATWAKAMLHPERLPNNGYPPDVKYLWKVLPSTPPEELTVEEYIVVVMEWIEKQVLDEKIFPTDGEEDFDIKFVKKYAVKIFQRMFRVFAILLVNPLLSGFGEKDTEETDTLKRLFSRFMCFAHHWKLLNVKETRCIDELVKPITRKYEVAKKNYEDQIAAYNRKHKASYNDV